MSDISYSESFSILIRLSIGILCILAGSYFTGAHLPPINPNPTHLRNNPNPGDPALFERVNIDSPAQVTLDPNRPDRLQFYLNRRDKALNFFHGVFKITRWTTSPATGDDQAKSKREQLTVIATKLPKPAIMNSINSELAERNEEAIQSGISRQDTDRLHPFYNDRADTLKTSQYDVIAETSSAEKDLTQLSPDQDGYITTAKNKTKMEYSVTLPTMYLQFAAPHPNHQANILKTILTDALDIEQHAHRAVNPSEISANVKNKVEFIKDLGKWGLDVLYNFFTKLGPQYFSRNKDQLQSMAQSATKSFIELVKKSQAENASLSNFLQHNKTVTRTGSETLVDPGTSSNNQSRNRSSSY